ncbi:2-amino-4-hydroxy-6-hydroxymethyldihydropteridine diphosphokinase [Aestuariicella hydrocarbonica]|uniref:2-amino-4-hydroxy-6-hydroxymethyldihydropteridine diphosphokinase n=1 Tax=Pseudomaricurvus hydrocarbonicus TaxID=1470433 RepID=A0A9E5MPU8_9GAMM|nr:2-amino-4-hydroxy-6-hydroxymethyldihydropteridine diphosphokinase [Aestuariicella hydrocarbonica]NHO68137.1 2-amino-4-hydroxy-6-hydroxymethyldihydropteridine diphosphokinase [Aestuariicella hydrocarbonica]
MARVYLSLGSNIEPRTYIAAGLDALADRFGELVISPVYESEAVGFDGDNFLNLVVGVETALSVGELSLQLKAIEDANGRERSGPKYSGRTLDIDILTYDDVCGVVDGITLPRGEVLRNAFVLQPLSDIAPQQRHAKTGESFADLWQRYDRDQKLWKIDFHWQRQQISCAD